MSVFKNILDSMVTQFQTYVTLTGTGDCNAIANESIVIRTPHYNRDKGIYEWETDEQTPGILIIPGRKISRPPEEGMNNKDDVHYNIMLQIIDTSQQRYDSDKLASWLDWHENLSKYLNHGNLRNAQFAAAGYVNRVILPEQDIEDKTRFIFHDFCVGYLFVEVTSREPRDSTGSL